MADTDKTLKLLIEMGVIGKEDVQAAYDLLKETSGGVNKFTQEEKDLKPATEAAGEGLHNFSLKGHEARHIVGLLNRAVPELGIAMRGLLTDAGPMVVVFLAMKVAMEYWQTAQENAKAATEAFGASLDKQRESSHNALEQIIKFNTAMANAAPPPPAYLKGLAEEEKILSATFEVKKKLLQIEEQAELKNAKTPAEKDAIRARYAGLEDANSQKEDAAKITAVANARIALENQKTDLQRQVTEIQNHLSDLIARSHKNTPITTGFGETSDQIKDLQHLAGNVTPEDVQQAQDEATKKIAELTKTLSELNQQGAELADKYKSASAVSAVKSTGRAEEQILNTPVPHSTQTAGELAAATGKTHAQVEAILKGVLNHTLNLGTVIAQMQWQLDQQAKMLANQRNRPQG